MQAYPYHDPQTGGQGYWRDVGTVDAYCEANMELIGVTPELNLATMRVGRSGPIRSRCRRPSLYSTTTTAGAAWRWTRWSRAATSFPARWCAGRCCSQRARRGLQRGPRRGGVAGVTIGRRCRLREVVIDKGCTIPDGTVIGEDLTADARRFHVTEGGVVLVTPEMLGQELHHVR